MKKANKINEVKANEVAKVIKDITNEVSAAVTPADVPPSTIAELWMRIDERLKAIEEKLTIKIKEGNGRGPISTRAMTVDDAKRIMTGDLKDESIKSAAQTLGLSYGQVYSARNGYTFKEQYTEAIAAKTKSTKK